MKIAIMQPTFLPWLGYFALMDYVDEFIFLDTVAIDKRSWQTRNKLKTADGEKLISVPVNASQGDCMASVQIAGSLAKQIRTIERAYAKSKYPVHSRSVCKIMGHGHKYLCSLNLHLMEYFIKHLEIKTQLICASQLQSTGSKSELLANICRERGATEYVSPPGSKAYLDATVFDCPVTYFDYTHPVYNQGHGEFISHLSVLDLLSNEGLESLNIIRTGYETGSHSSEIGVQKDTGQEYEVVSRETDHILYNTGS